MIIKFRDNTLNRLHNHEYNDDNNVMIQELRKEIELLQDQNEHHPEVTRFAAQCLELEEEIVLLREQAEMSNLAKQIDMRDHYHWCSLEEYAKSLAVEVNKNNISSNMNNNITFLYLF